MRRRIPWSLLLGVGAGLLLLRGARRTKPSRWPGAARGRTSLPREPEVVRSSGPTAVESGLERPVASAVPDAIPGRTSRAVPPPRRPAAPGPARFEPVLADAPELWDPAAEPAPRVESEGEAEPEPVAPTVRRRPR